MYNTTTILNLFSSLFDIFTLYIYLNEVLRTKKKFFSAPLAFLCFTLLEVVITMNSFFFSGDTSLPKVIFTTSLSFTTTFLISFLYEANLSHRLFISASYIIFTSLGESLFAMLLARVHPTVFSYPSVMLDAIISIGMQVFVLMFIILTSLFWNRNRKNYNTKYKLLLFVTPVMTVLIKLFIPESVYHNSDLYSFFMILFISLIVINIVNYFLLDNVLRLADMQIKYAQEQSQKQLQEERYEQLTSAYKQTRSIVHDVKEHYFFIDNCIQKEQYIAAADYMKKLVNALENSYTKVNTGNLVIDTLVSHYLHVSEEHKIRFEFDLNVDTTHIPTEEYDLCIILGNLLDNCLQACRQIPEEKERFITISIQTMNKHFTIQTRNPIVPAQNSHKNKLRDLYHGYGLNNVKKLTEDKYKGTFAVMSAQYYDIVNTIPYF